MSKTVFASLALLFLAACGKDGVYNSYSSSEEDTRTRGRLATDASFVKAKDGTLYSVSCLKAQSSKIAAGAASAGRECAAENLDESSVRGLSSWTYSPTFNYVNPLSYYGGSYQQTSNFCSTYFGFGGNSCFAWLGYSTGYYNSPSYRSNCSSCLYTSGSGTATSTSPWYGGGYGYPYNSCPSSCQTTSSWNYYPWYQNWNQNAWITVSH